MASEVTQPLPVSPTPRHRVAAGQARARMLNGPVALNVMVWAPPPDHASRTGTPAGVGPTSWLLTVRQPESGRQATAEIAPPARTVGGRQVAPSRAHTTGVD